MGYLSLFLQASVREIFCSMLQHLTIQVEKPGLDVQASALGGIDLGQ